METIKLYMPIIEFEGYLFRLRHGILIEPDPALVRGATVKLIETYMTTGRETGRSLLFKIVKVHRNFNRVKGITFNKIYLVRIQDYDELMKQKSKSHLKKI